MTVAQARTAVVTVIKLVVAPFTFGVLLLALLTTAGLLTDVTGRTRPRTGTRRRWRSPRPRCGGSAGGWHTPSRSSRPPSWFRRRSRCASRASAPYRISVMVLGEVRAGSLAAAAWWAVGATGLGWAVSVLLRRGRRAAAWLSSGMGALLLDAVTAVYVITALPPERVPRHNAPLVSVDHEPVGSWPGRRRVPAARGLDQDAVVGVDHVCCRRRRATSTGSTRPEILTEELIAVGHITAGTGHADLAASAGGG